MYFILLLVGAFGFVAMTLLGLGHGLGGHHSLGSHGAGSHGAASQGAASLGVGHGLTHGGGGHGATHGGSHAGSHTHSGQNHLSKPVLNKSSQEVASQGSGDPWNLLMAISPIDVFSTLFGAGAVGTLLQHLLTAWPLGLAAAVGGILFDLGFIRPFMGFLLRFASRPSEGLEGEVSSVGEAIIRFDSNGQGVIRINLDEQYRQLLASLDPDERSRGVAVAKGDKVVIVSVDAAKNSCVVSRELAYSGIDASEPSEFSFEKETKI